MKTPTLSLLVLRAADIEASLQFYRALGFDFVEERHGSGPLHYSCEMANAVLEIYPANDGASTEPKSAGAAMPGFTIDSLDDVLAALRELNIEPKTPPKISSWGRWINVPDPDGRIVQLIEATS